MKLCKTFLVNFAIVCGKGQLYQQSRVCPYLTITYIFIIIKYRYVHSIGL
jgi:hypothetical protein